MAQFINPRLRPKASTTIQSSRLRPRTRGRSTATRTSTLVARRSHTMVVGATSSNNDLAKPAPSWTEAIPMRTSQTGDTVGAEVFDEVGPVTGST